MAFRWQHIPKAAVMALFVTAFAAVAQAQPYTVQHLSEAPPQAAPTTPVWTVPPPVTSRSAPTAPSQARPRYAVMGEGAPRQTQAPQPAPTTWSQVQPRSTTTTDTPPPRNPQSSPDASSQVRPRYAVMDDGAPPPPTPAAPPQLRQGTIPPRAPDAPNYSIMNGGYRIGSYGPLGGAYTLGTGDKLRVTVYGEPDLSGAFEVDSLGDVRLPLIGQVEAAGLTVSDFEQSVTSRLASGYLVNPRVNAEVVTYRPFFIMGEVNKPGQYAYVNGMSVVTAVALAGGYTYRADDSDVYIRRDGQTREVERPADATTKIYPGDTVRVDERFF